MEYSSKLYLDVETQSELDLTKVGFFPYAEHESTKVLCMSYAVDNGPIRRWHAGEPFPYELFKNRTLVAHNIEFEKLILEYKMGLKTQFRNWICTMATARSQSLPGKLEDLGEFFKFRKDVEGSKIMKKLCKPRSGSKEFWTEREKPDEFEKLYLYCDRDVEVTRYFEQNMRPMTPTERRNWYMTLKINDRGIQVDRELIPRAEDILSREFTVLDTLCRTLVGAGVRQNLKLAAALNMESVSAESVDKALRSNLLEPHARKALEIRKKVGRSSIKKIPAFRMRQSGDGRIRGILTYAGAERTCRWSGAGIQPQNLPRGYGGAKLKQVIKKLKTGEIFEDAHTDLAFSLKGFFVGPFIIADYSQIECRVLAWLAGQQDQLDAFASGVDLYRRLAARVYGIPAEEIPKDSEERRVGKTVTLGCGYGMGHLKLQKTLEDLDPPVYVTEYEAKRIINIYRKSVPGVTNFWRKVELAFKLALRGKPNRPKGTNLKFRKKGSALCIELPSGRKMWYHRARLVGDRITYFGRDSYTYKYGDTTTYGGKITENICQAVARDIMADAMWAEERAGYPIVLTVHDEIVSEIKHLGLSGDIGKIQKHVDTFTDIMLERPPWAQDLPLAAEVKFHYRYQK